jgi:hypothetical protein
MGDPNDIWLCTFREERVSRTAISTSLVFDPKNKRFRVRVSQDYETQAKIEFRYLDADTYLADQPEYRDTAREAIKDHIADNPAHAKAMNSALARMKNL